MPKDQLQSGLSPSFGCLEIRFLAPFTKFVTEYKISEGEGVPENLPSLLVISSKN